MTETYDDPRTHEFREGYAATFGGWFLDSRGYLEKRDSIFSKMGMSVRVGEMTNG